MLFVRLSKIILNYNKIINRLLNLTSNIKFAFSFTLIKKLTLLTKLKCIR